MADVAHASLTGSDLHESKGVATATSGQVYVADGLGSGAWTFANNAKGELTTRFNDVSAPETIYVVIPYNCTITKVYTVIDTAITVADSTITCYNAAGSSMGTITIAFSGAAAGDVDSLTPASNNTFTAGTAMKIATDGASSTTSKCTITIVFTVTS